MLALHTDPLSLSPPARKLDGGDLGPGLLLYHTWNRICALQVEARRRKRVLNFSVILAWNRTSTTWSWRGWEMLVAWPFWGIYPLLETGERGSPVFLVAPTRMEFLSSWTRCWGGNGWRKGAFHFSNAINCCCSNQDLVDFLFKLFIHLLYSLRITFRDFKSLLYNFHQLWLFHWEEGPCCSQMTISAVVSGLLLFLKSSLRVGFFCGSLNQLSPLQLPFLMATTPWSWE